MSPNLDSLPAEIINQILHYFLECQRTKFVTVSKSWQGAVEQETFASLRVTNIEFKQFKKLIFGGISCRLGFIRKLHYKIYLPNIWSKQMKEVDKSFIRAVQELFEVLHVLDISHLSAFRNRLEISISVEENNNVRVFPALAGSEKIEYFPQGPCGQQDRMNMNLQNLGIPRLNCVTSLAIKGLEHRPFGGRTIASLVCLLPKLEELKAVMHNEFKSRLEFLRQQRHDCVLLVNLLPRSIKHLKLCSSECTPCLEDFQPVSSLPRFEPTYDRLSVQLRQSSNNLTSLILEKTRISASLFWPQDSESPYTSRTMPHWPHLKEFKLIYPLIDAFGNWMFGPHPNHQRVTRKLRQINAELFADETPINVFRCDPSPYMPAFYIAAARAAGEMPKLLDFQMVANFDSRLKFYHSFFYRTVPAGKTFTINWRSNTGWKPAEDVVQAWAAVGAKKYHQEN